MKIIGHRGARGLETENTIESIQKALDLGVDCVEFDVWTSKDNVPVVCHDSNLVRTTGFKGQIFDLSWQDIARHKTFAGQAIPTAREALLTAGDTPVFMEIKDYYLSQGVVDLLHEFRHSDIAVTSFHRPVLFELQKVRPDLRLYPSTIWNPVETLHFIRRHGFYGLSLYWYCFNPFIYWAANRNNINVRLYTVNNQRYVNLLKKFNMEVDLCTDFPNLLVPLVRKTQPAFIA